ncbi:putative integral membrane protein [Babesia bovis T2Bo]|uniref:putative integral membrane protein n=1 Tax=Babesia bovis T2Bo TaxID=484906 RepID=UPI001C36046D|nr:putative integral membrane protein [Babesia bovis T2Bo]EDO07640.2 putative integral membrane protein [Babesia bovis T2Bo]
MPGEIKDNMIPPASTTSVTDGATPINNKAGRRLSFFRAPSIFHSAIYGAVAGLAFYGGYYVYRALKLNTNNTEYYGRQSRWRHLEKQQLFQRELSQKMNGNFVANLTQEYDPVALRQPGGHIDSKHLL